MKLPVVSCAEMRRIEEQTFAGGVKPSSLMEEVGRQIARVVSQQLARPGVAAIYYGKGHNGGDALVAARHLAMAGWGIELHPLERDLSKLAELTGRHLATLHSGNLLSFANRPDLNPRASVVLDGLLGLGAQGPLREDLRIMTREINVRRAEGNARSSRLAPISSWSVIETRPGRSSEFSIWLRSRSRSRSITACSWCFPHWRRCFAWARPSSSSRCSSWSFFGTNECWC